MMKKNKGIVSIFLALIIMPVYSLAILTIDIVKVVSLRNHLNIANELVLNSILSNYDQDLFDKYELFGVDINSEKIKNNSEMLIDSNIKNISSFYNPKVTSFNLKTNDEYRLQGINLESQIIESMKFKGPYELSKGILNLINITKDTKKYTPVLNKKLEFEEAYSKVTGNFELLRKNFEVYDSNFEKINEEIFELNEIYKKHSENESDRKEFRKILEELKTNITLTFVNFTDAIKILTELSDYTNVLKEKLNEWGKTINLLEDSDVKRNFHSEYSAATKEITKENIDNLLDSMNRSSDIFDKYLNEISNIKFDDEEKLINYENLSKLPTLRKFKLYKFLLSKDIALPTKEEVNLAKKNKSEIEKFSNQKISESNSNKSIFDFINREEVKKYSSSSFQINNIKNSRNLGGYKSIFNSLTRDLELISDGYKNLLIAQYIVDKFSNKLDDREFSSEVEYILFGNNNLSVNESTVTNFIFGIRFLLNSIYAFTNNDLRTEATLIAALIAGWTGIGVYAVRSLILGGMSFGESLLDANNLNNGKPLEIFKNKANWQVSISGLKNLAGKQINEISNNAIENIYSSIYSYSDQGLDYLNNNINEFASQSINGITQSILAEIISPIQTTVFQNINLAKEIARDSLKVTLNEISSLIKSSNPLLDGIKKEVINHINSKFDELLNLERINFEQYFKNLSKNVEEIVISKTNSVTNELKNNIRNALDNDKVNRKKQVQKHLDKYLNSLGIGSGKIKGAMSGLNFTYRDYLVLLSLIRLSTDKSGIFNRMTLVINYNMRLKNPKFELANHFTNVNLKTSAFVNTFFVEKLNKYREYTSEISGGY